MTTQEVVDRLTARESEVVRRIVKGERIREIAAALGISGTTASIHANNARRKLGVQTNGGLVAVVSGAAPLRAWPEKPKPRVVAPVAREPKRREVVIPPEYLGKHRVYFIEAEGLDRIRIGYALNMRSRLSTLQCWCPVPLNIVASVEGGRYVEAFFHHEFRAYRLRGEWFTASPAVRRAIGTINETAEYPGTPPSGFEAYEIDIKDIMDQLGLTRSQLESIVGSINMEHPSAKVLFAIIQWASEHDHDLRFEDCFKSRSPFLRTPLADSLSASNVSGGAI